MNIDFNVKDDNIPQIKEASKLASVSTSKDYRVYGSLFCLGEGRPTIRIDASDKQISEAQEEELTQFFTNNGIPIGFYDDANEKHPNRIYIGLRADLRKNVTLSSCIVQTIVYFLEGRTKLDKNFKLKNIPAWEVPTTPEPIKEEKPAKEKKKTVA